MLLNKLESGFLLFQTRQGLVAVEPSFWQRVYLLWTFRNFRQLSLPLLNSRQAALINNLFLEHVAVVSDEYEPRLEIGVVENFVPPAVEIDAALAAKTDASLAMKTKLPEQEAEQDVAPRVMPIAAAPAFEFDVPPAMNEVEAEKVGAVIDRVEIAPTAVSQLLPPEATSAEWLFPQEKATLHCGQKRLHQLRNRSKNALDRLFAPIVSWLRLASSHLAASRPAASRPQVSRIAMSRFAAAIGALSLFVCFIVALHRIGTVPGSQARNSPPQLNSPDSPSAPGPAPVDENPATVPEGPPQAGPDPNAAVKPKPSPAKVASSITTTHPMMTPEPASRGAAARVPSRSSGGSQAAAFSRVPASASARPMTASHGSHAAMARSAQSYFDLADRQMHKGNYAAAAANYKRAWQIEEKSAAAKGRLVRARRAMQAEKESIANGR